MTDNKVYVDQNGNETVKVSRADGLGVSEIKKMGIEQIIISSEENLVVSARAKKLAIDCLQGIKDKKDTLIKFCDENKYDLKNTIFVGNDINDIEVMKIVGHAICPQDSHKKIKNISDYILTNKGGQGVIRELYDFIIGEIDNE